MERFFTDYLNRLESLHKDLRAALTGLLLAAVDWSPGEGMNSLGVIVVHVSGSERYWIGDIIAREPSGRVREAEFRSKGLEADALIDRLDASLAYVRGVLEGLKLEDLEQMRFVANEGQEQSVGRVLSHVLAHTGIHAGHAQLTRQLWEAKQ